MNQPLNLTGFRIERMLYSRIADIMAESGVSDSDLKKLLREGHGIAFHKSVDPWLFFIVSQEAMETFKLHGIDNPTWFQLIGSSETWAMDAITCEEHYRALKEGE